MSRKRSYKLHKLILFSTLSTNTPLPSYAIHNPVTTSFDPTKVSNLNNTAFFFKKIAFVGLAISQITLKQYKSTTLKSTLVVVWNSVAAYNFIF